MEIKIIKKCNLPIDSIQDLGQERNERAVKKGLAVWDNEPLIETHRCRCLKPFNFKEKQYLIGDDLLMTLEEIKTNKRFVFKYYAK
jgi:hypothetical protein